MCQLKQDRVTLFDLKWPSEKAKRKEAVSVIEIDVNVYANWLFYSSDGQSLKIHILL